ncbi:hypothetical protein MKY29_02985 [Psychrobacillus sp. FSL K6-2365]|uniref:hypothetical protein n=1 Tax=Psychrobacillus sp. FSL K6-2365 TaxID=2921546 RepID=UPI0030FCEF93
MKGLTKERMIQIIQANFGDGEVILERESRLKTMWDQFGDDYFIEHNEWTLTKKNENWKE